MKTQHFISAVFPLLFWRGFSSQRSCSLMPTSWQEVRQEMPIFLCFLGMVLLTSLPPSKQELFLWHWLNRMVEQLDRNQFPTEAVCETLGTCGGHVSFLFFLFHFFFPLFFSFLSFCCLFFFPSLLLSNFHGEPDWMQGCYTEKLWDGISPTCAVL